MKPQLQVSRSHVMSYNIISKQTNIISTHQIIKKIKMPFNINTIHALIVGKSGNAKTVLHSGVVTNWVKSYILLY